MLSIMNLSMSSCDAVAIANPLMTTQAKGYSIAPPPQKFALECIARFR